MSLVNQLMGGVYESVDLSGYDFSAQASTESYFLDSACESLVNDIFKVEQAYYTADIIGEVEVIREGADPEVLLEGIVGDAFGKLKEAFKKFLAKIKEWAAKVKKFFKVLFMKGKELAKTYGSEIRKKSVKGFKYKGFEYKIDAGDALVTSMSQKCDAEIVSLLGADNIASAREFDVEANKDKFASNSKTPKVVIKKSAVANLTTDMSASDYQDKFVKTIQSSCESLSELTTYIEDKYRNDETEKYEIEDFEANKPDEMIKFLETFDKNTKEVEKAEKAFEKDINAVIKELDKLSSTSSEKTYKLGGEEKTVNQYYTSASKISSFVSSALTVKKSIIDKQVAIWKEINSSFTSTLKSFLLKKEVKESAFFEDFDSLIALTEADDPEPDAADMEEEESATKEGRCGGKKTCESASLLEAAYNFI